MNRYEEDYPDYTAAPDYEHGDEIPSNRSRNATMYDVLDEHLASRRDFLIGGLAAAATSVFGLGISSSPAGAVVGSALGFTAIPVNATDAVVVPEGYKVQVLGAWGEPICGAMPGFAGGDGSASDQALQIGSHHDGMHFFPIDGSSEDGLLVLNHEYVESRFLHATYVGQLLGNRDVLQVDGERDASEVLKEMNAHGVSIYRARRASSGNWEIVQDPLNRRITALTEMEIGGPVRGSAHVVTRFSPDGTRTRGTLNNCSSGVTPWGTYLTAEENWAGYFVNHTKRFLWRDGRPREHWRYGLPTESSRYGWETAAGGGDEFIRFDATNRGWSAEEDYRNEPNTFGWMVEIDPFDPTSTPVKRTHLGRFAHEGVVFAPAVPGKPVVCYSGDDTRFEYIYKFVSAAPFDPETTDGTILDSGTLYVARFNADGSGDWLALAPGQNGLTPDNEFSDLADILLNTRAAADHAGATKMDRPEWGAVDPLTGDVYFTLSNNNERSEDQVDPANPRAPNQYGQIIRWTEAGGEHSSERFEWEIFLLAGSAGDSREFSGHSLGEDNIFACPDGLWFDGQGRLWIQTDVSDGQLNSGAFVEFGNNQMLVADPRTGEVKRFLTGPVGQEISGISATPDYRTLFVNVQHPGETTTPEDFAAGRFASTFPGGAGTVPRSCTLVITREDGGIIGS